MKASSSSRPRLKSPQPIRHPRKEAEDPQWERAEPEPPYTGLAQVCQSGGVHGRLINSLGLILDYKVCSLSVSKVQCYDSAGNTNSIYIMLLGVTPSGDTLEEYGFGQ